MDTQKIRGNYCVEFPWKLIFDYDFYYPFTTTFDLFSLFSSEITK